MRACYMVPRGMVEGCSRENWKEGATDEWYWGRGGGRYGSVTLATSARKLGEFSMTIEAAMKSMRWVGSCIVFLQAL